MSKIMGRFAVTSASIAASGSFTSSAIKIGKGENFSISVNPVTGTSPNFSIKYTVCDTEGGTYVEPDSNTICSEEEAAGVWSFTPVPAKYIKFVITNNNVTNAVVPTVKFMMQEEV